MAETRKRALITGASRGIGRITSLELARRGFDLTLLVRDRARGEGVVKEVEALGARAELLVADVSQLKEVERAAREFLAKHERLDVLVNNAGAIFTRREVTADGLEMTFAMNHLAYFVLTNLLRPALVKAAPSRVVVVASAAHKGAKLRWDDLQHERSYSGVRVYGESKLANILFARELARRLAGTGVTANSLHPGFVASNFGREAKGLLRLVMPLAHLFALSEEAGARTQVWAATAPELERTTGKYFEKSREATPTAAAQSDADAVRLWQVSEELVKQAGVALG